MQCFKRPHMVMAWPIFVRELHGKSSRDADSLKVHLHTPHFTVHEPLGQLGIIALQNCVEEVEQPGLARRQTRSQGQAAEEQNGR